MEPQSIEATFCFVDVSGFTALTEAHGDSAAADLVQRFVEMVRESLAAPGRLIDAIGDAVLVMHPEPTPAVAFVVRLFERASAEADFPALRAGLHHGPVVERAGRYFGATLNLAARVAGEARGGQILYTAPVAAALPSGRFASVRLGEYTLRNVRDRVALFALESPTSDVVIDPVCRMQVEPDRAPGRLRHEGATYWFCSLECAEKFAASPAAYTHP